MCDTVTDIDQVPFNLTCFDGSTKYIKLNDMWSILAMISQHAWEKIEKSFIINAKSYMLMA